MSFGCRAHSRVAFTFLSLDNLDIECALADGAAFSGCRVSINLYRKVRCNFGGLYNKLRFLYKVGFNSRLGIDKEVVIVEYF